MTEQRPDFTDLAAQALGTRPVIPADLADIGELRAAATEYHATEPGWAWTRLPLWLAQVKDTYENIGNRPILAVDICSSVPVYAQRLRLFEFDRHGERARELLKAMRDQKTLDRFTDENRHLKPVMHSLGRHPFAMRLIEAALQESLYEITAKEASGESRTNPRFRDRLRQKLADQHIGYAHNHEISHDNQRGPRAESRDYGRSYLEVLSTLKIPLGTPTVGAARERMKQPGWTEKDRAIANRKSPIGHDTAQEFIAWQADFFAQTVVGSSRFRPARFFSMDNANPRDIALSALARMPAAALQNDVFTHAINSLFDPMQHVQANIFDNLPLPDNSLALITIFDGWPFHFQTDPDIHSPGTDFGEVIAERLHHFYQKLAYGGRLVIFPWTTHDESYAERKGTDKALINIAASFTGSVDEQFDLKGMHRDLLKKYMSPADRITSKSISPIFQSLDDYFFALVISKSKESSLRALRFKAQTRG